MHQLLNIYQKKCSKFRISLNWSKCSVTCFRQNCIKNKLRQHWVEPMWETWNQGVKLLRKNRAQTRQKTSRPLVRQASLTKAREAKENKTLPYTKIHGNEIMEAPSMKLLGVHFHWTLQEQAAEKRCCQVSLVAESKHAARWVTHHIGKREAQKWLQTVCRPKATFGAGIHLQAVALSGHKNRR